MKSRLSRRWMPGFLKRRFDEKDTYQQLDISPAAHAGEGFRRPRCILAIEGRLAFVLRRRAGPRFFKNQLQAVEPGHRHAFGGRHGTRRNRVVRGRVLRRRRPSRRERRVAPLRRDGEARDRRRRRVYVGTSRRRRTPRGAPSSPAPSPRRPSASSIYSTRWGTSGTGGRGRRETRDGRRRGDDASRSGPAFGAIRTRRTSRGRRRGCFSAATVPSRWPPARRACAAPNPRPRRETTRCTETKKGSRVVPTPPRGARGG